jgi:hypothetical protein
MALVMAEGIGFIAETSVRTVWIPAFAGMT